MTHGVSCSRCWLHKFDALLGFFKNPKTISGINRENLEAFQGKHLKELIQCVLRSSAYGGENLAYQWNDVF